jgi:hypothetical protein
MSPALDLEAHAFGRYLVGRTPSAELVARYRAANETLFTEPISAEDQAIVAFARRHPWTVGPLDAATGLFRPGSALRNKILVMAAILEATPEFADEFLLPPVRPLALVLRVTGLGLAAVARTIFGVALLPLAARARA